MDTIEWGFSNDQWLASWAISYGLIAASGVPFRLGVEYAYSDQVVTAADDYVWSHSVAPPTAPTLTKGWLIVSVVGTGPINMSNPGFVNTVIRYGGVDLVPTGLKFDTIEHHGFALVAVLWVGDLTGFSGELLEVDMSIGYTGQTTDANIAVHVGFFDGVEDTADLDFTAGGVNTFATPLGIDPAPSNNVDLVITVGSAARLSSSDSGTIENATTGYSAAENTPSINGALTTFSYLMSCDTSYNCACEADPEAKTLLELRTETLKLTGYAMQSSNPPPGVASQYDAYLRTAQEYLYRKYKALETERFFSWTLTPGIRYYGLRDNRNCCDVKLNKYRITGAWLQDLNNVWWPLINGIDPTFYTLNVNFGWPAFYEVRQCIEIFPAPQAAYTLWIKGHFNLLPFEDDADVTTIGAEPVKNWAVFLAKAAKGAADAAVYSQMAKEQVGQLIMGAHGTRRYIPGTSEIPVPTPPIMVHFDA